MWLPEWLYRTLPVIYSLSGFLCFYFSDNGFGYLSGLLLITAGMMVWKLRRDFKEVGKLRPGK